MKYMSKALHYLFLLHDQTKKCVLRIKPVLKGRCDRMKVISKVQYVITHMGYHQARSCECKIIVDVTQTLRSRCQRVYMCHSTTENPLTSDRLYLTASSGLCWVLNLTLSLSFSTLRSLVWDTWQNQSEHLVMILIGCWDYGRLQTGWWPFMTRKVSGSVTLA